MSGEEAQGDKLVAAMAQADEAVAKESSALEEVEGAGSAAESSKSSSISETDEADVEANNALPGNGVVMATIGELRGLLQKAKNRGKLRKAVEYLRELAAFRRVLLTNRKGVDEEIIKAALHIVDQTLYAEFF